VSTPTAPIRHAVYTAFCLLPFTVLTIFLYMPLQAAAARADRPVIELSAAEQAWLDAHHTVRVRVGNWPPFTFSSTDTTTGIAIEYLDRVFDTHSISHQYIPEESLTWKETLAHMRQHEVVDLIPTAKITDERLEHFVFSDEYLFLPWVIFTRTDAPFVGSIRDLAGKTVAVQNGFVMHGILKESYPEIGLNVLDGVNVADRCMQALSFGKVDALVANLTVGTYLIQNRGYTNVKIAAPTPFDNHNQAMAMRNDWPELATIINKTLASMTPAEKAGIQSRWMAIHYEHGLNAGDIVKWVGIATGVAALIIAFITLWNRRLSREIAERKRAEAELREALDEVHVLGGMLPICASCKKIRDDQGFWQQVENYIQTHTEATFSHGICPECVEKLYPDFAEDDTL
jgi:ABC-type amino acid transport substrate-binding protein